MENDTPNDVQPPTSTIRPHWEGIIRQLFTPLGVLILFVAIISISISYYFVVALPSHNRALLELERQKFEAAQEVNSRELSDKTLKEELAKIDADYRQTRLDNCIDEADKAYWSYVKLNGKPVPGKEGTYTAPMPIWDAAKNAKKDALDECHRQWDPK